MTGPVQTVARDAGIESAAQLMSVHQIAALPVVDPRGGLVGMVSEGDLLWHRVPPDPTARVRCRETTDPGHRPARPVRMMNGGR